jgi:hypothetical protein
MGWNAIFSEGSNYRETVWTVPQRSLVDNKYGDSIVSCNVESISLYFRQIANTRISETVIHKVIIPLPPRRPQPHQATTRIINHQPSPSAQVLQGSPSRMAR